VSFNYLLDKIRNADFRDDPYKHVEIDDFFSDEHFQAITAAKEINITNLASDSELLDKLIGTNYKIIDFPGCILDKAAYLKWHQDRNRQESMNNSACEGFGMTLRLYSASSPVIQSLMAFLESDEFKEALAQKFGTNLKEVTYDHGIQKYLDGYEISPHPDIRKKALTFMVNINPSTNSDDQEHHTHYMTFKPEFKYVQSYWEGRPQADRCWVPWDWCTTQKVQNRNNSIVIFAPADDTLHAVRAKYDHLRYQRTQLYGNFWFQDNHTTYKPEWENLEISAPATSTPRSIVGSLKELVPESLKSFVRRSPPVDPTVVKNRLKN